MGSRTFSMPPVSGAALLAAALLPACGSGRADTPSPRAELRVARKSVEDVFLLTGELRAVRSVSLVTPRGEGELQIRWMVEDGSEVKEGERLVEFDAARLIQTIEERRLKLRQAENDRESRERSARRGDGEEARRGREGGGGGREGAHRRGGAAGAAPGGRVAEVPGHLAGEEGRAREGAPRARGLRHDVLASEIATARAAEEKARREVAAVEKSLGSMSLVAPKAGIFLVGNFWQWGPEGPRKLQPGDTVWPGYTVGTIPDPTEMEVWPPSPSRTTGGSPPG